MAKKRKVLPPLKNYTLDELLSMDTLDLMKMNAREMRHAVRTLNLVANKRLARLQKAVREDRQGVSERGLTNSKGQTIEKFTISRSASLNEARNKFKNVAHYLNRKTTTIEGAKKEFDRQAKKLFDDEDISFSNDEIKELWHIFRELDEAGFYTQDFDSEKTQRKIGEYFLANKYTNDEIYTKVRKDMKDAYNDYQKKQQADTMLARHRQSRSQGDAASFRKRLGRL